ncbi:MAG: hypothetical protein QF719_07705 [Chloroflexota bacterium]|nr:hypothetical protein [Chloroflexota bacterium]MDP6508012.1 hypothetical protein [Chloroflexota bacterium]MDP6758079.1 hypothetical protein [Chloroflexota bacterium]
MSSRARSATSSTGRAGDQAGVGADAVLVEAPEGGEGQPGSLGDTVAEGHVDNPAAAGLAQEIGVALEGEGVLADELPGNEVADQRGIPPA